MTTSMDVHKFINDQAEIKGPHGWIQWKGTRVCIDLYCECGAHGHIDAEFFYFYECFNCHRKYGVGGTVKLVPLGPDQVAAIESQSIRGFISDERGRT